MSVLLIMVIAAIFVSMEMEHMIAAVKTDMLLVEI
jgi:hypothetical protein